MRIERIVALWLLVLPIAALVTGPWAVVLWSDIPIMVGFAIYMSWAAVSLLGALVGCSVWLWKEEI